VYGVTVTQAGCRLRLTMTSAACPVADLIVEEAERELGRALPDRRPVEVDLVWEPSWSPERMSERGRRFMGW
ncbi:MAG TPA: iron-sulfur cluster assembly protein, partial [Steroidobacteraceae bacterium]|nr:iron-sulfur cluster assembly protein [Steroidobacteraceae bacterium]